MVTIAIFKLTLKTYDTNVPPNMRRAIIALIGIVENIFAILVYCSQFIKGVQQEC